MDVCPGKSPGGCWIKAFRAEPGDLYSQALATLGAPGVNDCASAPRFHADAKTVGTLAPSN
jgi:hypothetical protein